MVLFRPHRGSLAESMREVREVDERMEITWLTCLWVREVKPYGFDARIGWDTHIVLGSKTLGEETFSVIGFTNGPLER